LRRFRHFRRYYYEFDDDWARLEYLVTVYDRLQVPLKADVEAFVAFLLKCADDLDSHSQ
jgi:hypothetical protein